MATWLLALALGAPAGGGGRMTEDQALAALKAEWAGSIKAGVDAGRAASFQGRLDGTASEKVAGSFRAALVDSARLTAPPTGPALYAPPLPDHLPRKVWHLEWTNLLSGGWVVWLDPGSGKVLRIDELVEG